MSDDVLDILVVMDRSGSMRSKKSDHEGGLQAFVEEQAKVPGDVRLTLIQFDDQDPCDVVYDRVPVGDVKGIALSPRGWTPLLDGVGRATAHMQDKTPNVNVLCMIVTDGMENASKEWTKAAVAERIKSLEALGWTFLFLGANIDSVKEAGDLGLHDVNIVMDMNADDGDAIKACYMASSQNLRSLRQDYTKGKVASASAKMGDFKSAMNFTDEQRARAKGTS